MKRTLCVLGVALACSAAFAQQPSTVLKEGAKATGEKAQQVGDETKAAVSSQPSKSVDKTKAQMHKAKAHGHAHAAKEAAKQPPN